MKKILLLGSIFAIFGLGVLVPKTYAATCTPVTSVFPAGQDSFTSGDCVPSSVFNSMESEILSILNQLSSLVTSVNNATGTVSIVGSTGSSVSTTGNTITVGNTGLTSLNTATGTVNIVGSGSASVSQVGNTITINALSAGSSSPAGISGNVQYNLNGVLAATSTFNVSSTGELLIQNLETTRYADQFPGVDMATQIDNAEVNLCATVGGGTIVVPAGKYSSTNPIIIATCPTIVTGQGGGGFFAPGATTLIYNGTGTAYTYNVAGYSSAGVGIQNLSLIGPAGVYAGGNTGIGSSVTTSSYGILAGGFAGTVSSASTTSNLITYSASVPLNFANGQAVQFSGGSLPGGISGGTTYYLSGITANTFSVFTDSSLTSRVILTSNGTGSFSTPGSGGIFGFSINGVNVSGFGTALEIGTNASFLNMTNSVLQKNGMNINSPQVTGANGENLRVNNSIIADANSSDGISISDNCIVVQQSGNVQWSFSDTSFDDCQIVSTQFGGTANVWNFTNDHDEDPNTGAGAYERITTQASQAGAQAVVINISGGDFMEDKTSGAKNEFIQYGGTLNLANVTGDINNNVSLPMADFATPLNSTAIISWNGLANQGYNTSNSANTGFTDVYGSVPYTIDGDGVGNSAPNFSVTNGGIGRVNIQDLNTYLYVPTTFATTGCVGSSTATDFGACVDAMYQSRQGLASSVIIMAPTLANISYSVPINFNINGLRADLVGVAGEGTTITYTGTGAAIILNYGIQSTGVSHTIGQGTGSINLMGNNTATSSGQIGVLVGGGTTSPTITGGAAGTVINDMDISGFGYGLVLATNTYNFTLQDSLIRNNGQNVFIQAPANSGESDRFTNDFIVDGANNNPNDCFFDSISGNSGLYIDGTSFDDCQVHLGQAVLAATFSGDYWENPGHTKWLSYPYLIVDPNSSGVNATTIVGGLMMNDASNSLQYPPYFISNGDSMTITGLGAYNNAAGGGHPNTVPLLVLETGSHAHTVITGFNNEVNAVQNTIGTIGSISNYSDSTSTIAANLQFLNLATSSLLMTDANGNVTTTSSNYLQINNNLSDLTNTSTARTNLGFVNPPNCQTSNGAGVLRGLNYTGTSNCVGAVQGITIATGTSMLNVTTSLSGVSATGNATITIPSNLSFFTNDLSNFGFTTSSVSVSSCGTGSPTITGSNNVGAIVTGSSASSCTVNFATPTWKNPPVCMVSDSNTTAVTDVSAVSSSSVTFSLASALSAVNMYYSCWGNPN